jgi:hypothetical protein
MIEVKGYASSVGIVTLNQKLSEDRADAVCYKSSMGCIVPGPSTECADRIESRTNVYGQG